MDLSENLNKKHFEICSCTGIRSDKLPVIKDFLTIVGSAECVRNDIGKYGYHGDIMVVNQVALYFPHKKPYQHLVTEHHEFIKPLSELRRMTVYFNGINDFKTHTFGKQVKHNMSGVDYLWDFLPKHQSSGLLALFIGIALGYNKILLHGIPLDRTKRFHDLDPCISSKFYSEANERMLRNDFLLNYKDIVRSSSGNTMKFFGEPTEKWINS